MRIISLSVLLLVIIGVRSVYGQPPDFDIDTHVSGPVTVCGDAITFTVRIKNLTSSPAQNVRLVPQMPTGMLYVAGTAQGMSVFNSLPAQLTFSITDLGAGEEREVVFQARANCSLISFLNSSGSLFNLVNNDTKLTYSLEGISKEALEPNGSESYSVLYPQLEVTVPQAEKNIAVEFIHTVKNRNITIRNTGLGRLSSLDFYLKKDPELNLVKLEWITNSGVQVLTHVSNTTAQGYRYTLTDFSRVGDGDAFFEEGEEIVLKDYVNATTSKASIATIYTARWGCDGLMCNSDEIQASTSVYIEAIGGKAIFSESYQVLKTTDFCNDTPAQVRFTLTNSGSGNLPVTRDGAYDLSWLYFSMNFETQDDHHFYIQHADNTLINVDHLIDFTQNINVSNGFTRYQRYYRINFSNTFNYDPDGVGGLEDLDNDGFYDDLAPGQSLRIVAHLKYSFNHSLEIGESDGTYFYGRIEFKNWHGGFETQGTVPSRRLLRILSYNQSLTGLPDLLEGQTRTIRLTVEQTDVSDIIHHNNSMFEFIGHVPNGVLVNSVKWGNQLLSFTQSGNVVTVLTPLNRFLTLYNIDFEFSLNCNEVAASNGEFRVTGYYYSDPLCPNTKFKIAEVSKILYLHCGACNSIATTNFSVERKTLGWVNRSGYRFGQLFGATPSIARVTRNTTGIRLKAGYEKDEVEFMLTGTVVGSEQYHNLIAELSYLSPFSFDALEFNRVEFAINNVPQSLPHGFAPVVTMEGNSYKYVFNLPIQGSLTSGATFQLKVTYLVSSLPAIGRGAYKVSNLRGIFYSQLGASIASCAGRSEDDFTVLKPLRNISSSFLLEEPGKVVLAWFTISSAIQGVIDFPSEYRPINYLTNHSITLPKGFVFDTSKPLEPLDVSFNFHYSSDKRTITLLLNDHTPLLSSNSAVIIYGHVNIDCNPGNIFEPRTGSDFREYTGSYALVDYAYLPLSQHVNSSPKIYDYQMINNRRPNLRLTANSEQEAFTETVTWPVQLCNSFASRYINSKHTWVAVELKNNDHSTLLQGAFDENGSVLPVIFYGPKDSDHPNGRHMLVQMGEINLSACKHLSVVARYKNCEDDKLQELDVYASWDLRAYPNLNNYAGSIVNNKASCEGNLLSTKMYIKYKTAAMQWNVVKSGPDEVDLCVSVPFEIDLASTKYADMTQLRIWLELPAHLTLDQASALYTYPHNGTPAVIPADAYVMENGKFGIDIQKLTGGIGLPGTRQQNNKLKLNFGITAHCGFDPGLPIRFKVDGLTNCGDPITFVDQRKIRLTGFELDQLDLSLSASHTPKCGEENTITLSLKNNGEQPSDANELEVTLPYGTAYLNLLQGDVGEPTVSTVHDQLVLHWILPAGYLAAGQTKALSFKVVLNQTLPGTTSIAFAARTQETGNANCADNNVPCVSKGTTGSHELTLPVTGLSSLEIAYSQYVCAYQFTSEINETGDCTIISYRWNFGDGFTSTELSPVHSFAPGTYTISLQVTFDCDGCSGTMTRDTQLVVGEPTVQLTDAVIDVLTEVKKQVIQVSASTFSDSWLLEENNPVADNRSSFENGSQGVWRNDATYVYQASRRRSEQTDISRDGTFTLENFNWAYAAHNAIPHWIKANTMTRYSAYSYELENQDVLGVYSAALYDYGGHLPSANGMNMRHAEMAFTSFEYLDNRSSGNWVLGNDPVPAYREYRVISGKKNMAVVEAKLSALSGVTHVDVLARSIVSLAGVRHNYIQNNRVVCMLEHPENPEWSVIVLQRPLSDILWMGYIRVKQQVLPAVTADIDHTIAHTGRSSLKVFTDKTFGQPLLKLDSGKTYWVSAWVSVNQPVTTIPVLAAGLGYEITIRNRANAVVGTWSFEPQGKIIEGWQQVKGRFTCPINDARVEIKFRSGSTGIAWYDDLRLHPEKGNMKAYVYDLNDYRLRAILDEENFASLFYYDQEGNLYLTKKETEEGIKTITENVSYQKRSGQ